MREESAVDTKMSVCVIDSQSKKEEAISNEKAITSRYQESLHDGLTLCCVARKAEHPYPTIRTEVWKPGLSRGKAIVLVRTGATMKVCSTCRVSRDILEWAVQCLPS